MRGRPARHHPTLADSNSTSISASLQSAFCEYLHTRQCLDTITAKIAFSTDILNTPDNTSLHEAGLRVAAIQMLDRFARLAASPARDDNGSEQLIRLVNALARLTHQALVFRKYGDARDEAQKLALAQFSPGWEFSPAQTSTAPPAKGEIATPSETPVNQP